LPGLGDGPTTVEESLEMARMAARDGTGIIVATPHYRDMELEQQTPGIILELADTLDAELRRDTQRRNSPAARILTGMVHRLDTSLQDLVDSENAVTLNRSRFILVEPLFTRLPSYVDEMIGRLLTQRLVPVIAHPERNIEFQRNPKRLQLMVEDGVMVQLASGSIMGRNGPGARRAAEQFIRRGIAHVVASEMHSSRAPRSPLLTGAFEIVSEWVGEDEAIDLFETNPDMMLEGRTPQLRERESRHRLHKIIPSVPSFEIENSIPERTRRKWQRRFR
tara:strand:- start:35200 stop:36033 length:834 start_codon:yes stop_codon:yes gene_type:complete